MRVRPSILVAAAVRRARGMLAASGRPAATETAPLAAAPPDENTLTRFEAQAAQLTPAERQSLDPTTHPGDFRQPNDVSCGASCLVFSRMVHDAPYAMWVVRGYDPRRERHDTATPADRWTAEVLAMHRRVTRLLDHDGDLQFPWLRIAGTSPWGAARQLEGIGGAGLPIAQYAARTLDPDDLDGEFDRIVDAVDAGHTVPLYVGTDLRPAHVVLVLDARDDRFRAYEPSVGRLVRVSREEFVSGDFRLGGWSVPWFAVLPA